MRVPDRLDETAVKRGFLTLCLIAGAVGLSFYAVRSQDPLYMMLVPFMALGAWMLGNPAAMLLAMLLIKQAAIKLPGLPGGLSLMHLFSVAIIGWAFIYAAVSKQRMERLDPAGRWLVFFLINMALIMRVRGFGIALMGSSDFGGKTYLFLIIGLLLYFAMRPIRLNEKHIRILFFGGVIASVLPFLVQVSIYVTDGATYYLNSFIDAGAESMVSAMLEGSGDKAVRWHSLGSLAKAILAIALVLPGFRNRTIMWMSLLGAVAFLTALTGFRGQMMGLMFVVFVWLVYDSKNRKHTFFALLGIGFVGWLAAIALLPILPDAAQRSLSFLPLAKERITDQLLLRSAQASIDWRVEVWKMAWSEVPRYLLVGRGLTFEVAGWSWLQAVSYQTPEFNYANHNYHSGPLSLLVDYGLPGFICGTGFMITIVVQAWRGVQRFCAGRNDLLSRYYVLLTIQLTWAVVAYFFIFGHASDSIPTMVLSATLLFIFRRELSRVEAVQCLADTGIVSSDRRAGLPYSSVRTGWHRNR